MIEKSRFENFIQWLYKYFVFVWVIIGISIFLIIFFNTKQISFLDNDWSEIGWEHFVNIFIVPLTFIGLGIPIYGIIVTMYRSIQNEKQLKLFSQNVNFNNYYRHMDELVKTLSSYSNINQLYGRGAEEDFYKYLYTKWFGTDYNIDFKIPDLILSTVKQFYDEIENVVIKKVELNKEKIKNMILLLGFEKKIDDGLITELGRGRTQSYITHSIRMCEKILEFSNQSVEKNDFILRILK